MSDEERPGRKSDLRNEAPRSALMFLDRRGHRRSFPMKNKPLALAAAALLAGYLGLGGGARAANVMTAGAMPDIATSQDGNIQPASHHHHHHGFGSSIFLGFGFPGF